MEESPEAADLHGVKLAGWVSPEEAPELPSFALVLSWAPWSKTELEVVVSPVCPAHQP